MKRWLIILGAIALFGASHPVSAATLSYQSFRSDITVNTDASIAVHETIVVDFSEAHHGIFRNIPFRFTTTDGGSASIPIDQLVTLQDGQSVPVAITKSGSTLTAKIGDPDTTITGRHTYDITYRAQAAVNFFADHDELYWNVTGDDWDAPLNEVQAVVHVPGGNTDSQLRLACYTGAMGSRATDCTQAISAGVPTFSASTYLTVVVGWPKGIVTKPAEYDSLRAKAGHTFSSGWFSGWSLAVNVIFPLVVLALMWWIWSVRGRDPKEKGTVVVQYDPPAGLRPAEVGVLMGQQANSQCISATIVDLAVRHYLRIEETEQSTLLGLSHKHDYVLVELKQPDDQLRPYERDLQNAIFRNPKVPADGSRIALSQFVKRRTAVMPFKTVVKQMTTDMVERGYFSSDPAKARSIPTGVAAVLAYIGFQFGTIAPGFILAAIIVGVFGWLMPRKTPLGVEAAWQAKGFKEYLKTAERYRLQWQERQHIFETFLPYAMVLGVAHHWSQVLSSIATEQPDWYVGAPGAQFNALVFYASLSSFNSMLNTSAVSGAASGSSGFGGGGFSGGGGGGGGGGW